MPTGIKYFEKNLTGQPFIIIHAVYRVPFLWNIKRPLGNKYSRDLQDLFVVHMFVNWKTKQKHRYVWKVLTISFISLRWDLSCTVIYIMLYCNLYYATSSYIVLKICWVVGSAGTRLSNYLLLPISQSQKKYSQKKLFRERNKCIYPDWIVYLIAVRRKQNTL